VDLRLEDFMTFRLLLNDPMVKCFNDSIETDWRKHSRGRKETEEQSGFPKKGKSQKEKGDKSAPNKSKDPQEAKALLAGLA
jgi:hypothetical protein